MTCLRQVENGIDNIIYRRFFHSWLQGRVVGIIAVHQIAPSISSGFYLQCEMSDVLKWAKYRTPAKTSHVER